MACWVVKSVTGTDINRDFFFDYISFKPSLLMQIVNRHGYGCTDIKFIILVIIMIRSVANDDVTLPTLIYVAGRYRDKTSDTS